MKPPTEFQAEAARLRAIREHLQLSREDVARLIDRSEKTVKQAELGLQRLGKKAWQRMEALREEYERTGRVRTSQLPAPQSATTNHVAVAAVVADSANQAAVKAMVGAGVSELDAWESMLRLKLK